MKDLDKPAAHDLALYAVNNGNLYRQRGQPIILNLARKQAAGKYDASKAPALWRYLADDAAQRYTVEYGSAGPHGSYGNFSPATRVAAAVEIAAHYADELRDTAADLTAERENRKRWKLSDIRHANDKAGRFFFSPQTMRFFGDRMANFGVRYEGRRIFVERKKQGSKGGGDVGALREFFPESGEIGPNLKD